MAVLREGIFNTLSFAGDYAAQRLRLMRNMITPLHGKQAFPFAHRSRQALHQRDVAGSARPRIDLIGKHAASVRRLRLRIEPARWRLPPVCWFLPVAPIGLRHVGRGAEGNGAEPYACGALQQTVNRACDLRFAHVAPLAQARRLAQCKEQADLFRRELPQQVGGFILRVGFQTAQLNAVACREPEDEARFA